MTALAAPTLWRPPPLWTPLSSAARAWADRKLREMREWLAVTMGLPASKDGVPLVCGGAPANDSGGMVCCVPGSSGAIFPCGCGANCQGPITAGISGFAGCGNCLVTSTGSYGKWTGSMDGVVTLTNVGACQWYGESRSNLTFQTFSDAACTTALSAALHIIIGVSVVVNCPGGPPALWYGSITGNAELSPSGDASISLNPDSACTGGTDCATGCTLTFTGTSCGAGVGHSTTGTMVITP